LRPVWLAIGICALVLGAIGVVLPLLPTTPFILLAAFAFAQSSKRMHAWLHEHSIFGPIIENWHRHRAIARRAKIAGVGSMAAVLALSFAMGLSPAILIVQAVVLSIAGAFVVSRPSPPD